MALHLGSCRPPRLLLGLRRGQEGERAEIPMGPPQPSQDSPERLL